MKEQIIAFDTAKLAKKKGFSEMCTAYYTSSTGNGLIARSFNQNKIHLKYGKYCSAPTQSLLQKWLREKFNSSVRVDHDLKHGHTLEFSVQVYDVNNWSWEDVKGLKTYEEALEEGLNQALKLIKP